MNPEKKFEMIDKLTELSSAINCLSLDPESMTNSNVKAKIESLVSGLKMSLMEVKEESICSIKNSNPPETKPKLKKDEKGLKTNANRKKVFADGANGFTIRIISFDNKYAITTHEKGEINLWDIEFFTHLDKNCTSMKGNAFSLVKLHEKAMKFATCDFVDESSLVFWSITKRGTICVENIFHLNFKTRGMSFLKTDNQSFLLLARADNKIDIWDVKCDFIMSVTEHRLTIQYENPITCLNFIHYIPVKTEVTQNKILCEDNDMDFNPEVYNETYILGGGRNGELIHIGYSSKEGLFEKHCIEEEGGPSIVFKYNSGEKDQIEAILPLFSEDKTFITGSLGSIVQLYKVGEPNPLKKVYTFPDVVTSFWFNREIGALAVGSKSLFLFDVNKSSSNLSNEKATDYDFSLNEIVDSGFVVDDFVVKFEENMKRSTFVWLNMDSRLLRIITPKYVVK